MTPHGSPPFNTLQSMIRKRLDQGVSRRDLLDHLVDAQLKRSLGQRVTPAMRRQALDRFRTDPHLRRLSDALLAAA